MKKKTLSPKIKKLADRLSELGYEVRFVKGQFESGHCVLRDNKMILVNRYFDEDGKILILKNLYTELCLTPSDEA